MEFVQKSAYESLNTIKRLILSKLPSSASENFIFYFQLVPISTNEILCDDWDKMDKILFAARTLPRF